MDWIQISAFFIGNACVTMIGCIHISNRMLALQKCHLDAIIDFHGRLCAIEERYQIKRHQNHGH